MASMVSQKKRDCVFCFLFFKCLLFLLLLLHQFLILLQAFMISI